MIVLNSLLFAAAGTVVLVLAFLLVWFTLPWIIDKFERLFDFVTRSEWGPAFVAVPFVFFLLFLLSLAAQLEGS